jgi:arabinose-5-phosphate isomerase
MTIERARRVLKIEAEAIAALADRLGPEFVQALDLLLACPGKVAVTGMGKSGIIGRKIASTLASTGTPAFFLHAAEGVHGDVGMLTKDDLALVVSNSGETEEIIRLLPVFKRLSLKIIALVGRLNSTLAQAADVVLDASVKEEACPLNLAPTASTTAALALGDALALALLERRGFNAEDFARLHPSGVLGRRLLLRVSDLMHTGERLPRVSPQASIRQVILEMSGKLLGHTAVVEGDQLLGVISDGDLRRALERDQDFLRRTAQEIMTARPKFVTPDELAASALEKMERHAITGLLVCDDPEGRRLVGFVHLHDLLKAGVT